MGQVFYRDYEPVNIFPFANAQPQLESWQMRAAVPYAEPLSYMDNRSGLGPYSLANRQHGEYTLDEMNVYPIADEHLRFAPAEPIRQDTFMALAQRFRNPAVAGSAPTHGIYTGLIEED